MSFEPVIRRTKNTQTRLAPIADTSTETGTQTEPDTEPEPEQETEPITIGVSQSTINSLYQSGSGSIISTLVQNNAELERKLNGLMDYLEKWINVGNLNMNDLKQYIENYSN